jgi:predicted metal-dependent hydrolase
MIKKVVQLNSIGIVTLSQNVRSKSIRVSVKPNNSILVSFPLYVSYREAIRFTEQHAQWITSQQEKLETSLIKYSEDSILKTRFYQITLHRYNGRFAVMRKNGEMWIMIPEEYKMESVEVQDYIRKAITGIYRWEANMTLPARVKELAFRNNFQFNKITIRNNKGNWGSCSGKNNISLNLHLMKMPDHLIDFIILHELVHTKVKNHSPAFWQMLDSVTGNQAKQLTKELMLYARSACSP